MAAMLWSWLASVDQMKEEYRDPETSAERRLEIYAIFCKLYEVFTEFERDR